jgi:hypothetical protein
MNALQLTLQIVQTYERHNWTLRRMLVTSGTRNEINQTIETNLKGVRLIESDFDALWFARPSTGGREAWELRLLSEQPYALFEAFDADENEEDRENARREIEARMREHVGQR